MVTPPVLAQRRAILDGELGDVASVRRSVGGWLRDWGLEPLVEDVELVASELTTNAILHAGGALDVVVEKRGEGVRVVVRDERPDVVPGPTAPLPRLPGPGDSSTVETADDELERLVRSLYERTTTGRGLLVVEAYSDAWGVDVDTAVKGVWAEVGTGRPQRAVADLPAGVPPAGGVPVHLQGVPVRLVLFSAANLDDLVREVQTTDFEAGEARELAVLADRLAQETAGQREPLRAAARAAVQTRTRMIDVELQVPPGQVGVLSRFVGLTDQVEHLCRTGVLISGPPTPEITAFRRWFIDELGRQVAGTAPTRCPFAT